MKRIEAEAAVVGAGVAGSAAALALSRAGLDVVLLDAQPLPRAGATWQNAIPPWMFAAGGIAPPAPPESVERRAFTFLSRSGCTRLRIDPAPYVHVRMPALIGRLRREAIAAGTRVVAPAKVVSVSLDSGRPVSLRVEATPEDAPPATIEVCARLFVDASGIWGALRCRVPATIESCPTPVRSDLCSAAQETCEITDRAAAMAFLEHHGVAPGEAFGWVGRRGGFSTVCIETDPGLCEVGVLAGVVADGSHGTGPGLLAEVKAENPWIGRGIAGGAGMIPLARPYPRLVSPGLALVGDAARQVFPAHASGCGMAFIAARMLAEAVAGAPDPGDEAVLWRYACRFQRLHGGVLAGYDAFRLVSQRLSGEESDALLESGLMGEGAMRSGMEQRPWSPSARDLPGLVRGAFTRPGVFARVAGAAARMVAAMALYRAYPGTPDPERLARWTAAEGRLFAGA